MTDWKSEWKPLAWIVASFLALLLAAGGHAPASTAAVLEALHLAKWYAREHVLLCLVPAFFIAGAIAVFVSQASVMKYLGARAKKVLAYGVASVSGTILAVCSCTVLPLFAGIYRMGAGLGPATAFLYSGPGDQRPGHRPDRARARPRAGRRPGRGRRGVRRRHRAAACT